MTQQPHNAMREHRHYTADDYEHEHNDINRKLGQTLEHLRQQGEQDER